MLAYILALVVGLGSFALYMAAFFFPEVHRRNDFIWSGIGLFYALVLWICAGRITGGVLLGQTASVALLGWLGWQTFFLRRQTAPADQQTPVPSSGELRETFSKVVKPETFTRLSEQTAPLLAKVKTQAQGLATTVTKPKEKFPLVPQEEPYVPLTPADFAPAQRARLVESTIDADITAPALEAGDTATDAIDPKVIPSSNSLASVSEFPEVAAAEVSEVAEEISDNVEKKATPVVREIRPTSTPTTPAPAAIGTPKEKPGSLFAVIADVFKGFLKKPESKPTYVRKQFRTPEGNKSNTVKPAQPEASGAPSKAFIKDVAVSSSDPVSAKAAPIVEPEATPGNNREILPLLETSAVLVEGTEAINTEQPAELSVVDDATLSVEPLIDSSEAALTEIGLESAGADSLSVEPSLTEEISPAEFEEIPEAAIGENISEALPIEDATLSVAAPASLFENSSETLPDSDLSDDSWLGEPSSSEEIPAALFEEISVDLDGESSPETTSIADSIPSLESPESLFQESSETLLETDFSYDLPITETSPAIETAEALFAETPATDLETGFSEASLLEDLPFSVEPSEELFAESSETLLDQSFSSDLRINATSPPEASPEARFEGIPEATIAADFSEISFTQDLPPSGELLDNAPENLFETNSEALPDIDFPSDPLSGETSSLEEIPEILFEDTPAENTGDTIEESFADVGATENFTPAATPPENLFAADPEALLSDAFADDLLLGETASEEIPEISFTEEFQEPVEASFSEALAVEDLPLSVDSPESLFEESSETLLSNDFSNELFLDDTSSPAEIPAALFEETSEATPGESFAETSLTEDLPLSGELPSTPAEKLFEENSETLFAGDFSDHSPSDEPSPAAEISAALFKETSEANVGEDFSKSPLLEDAIPAIELSENSSESLFEENFTGLPDNDSLDDLQMDGTSPAEEDLGDLFESAPAEGSPEVLLTEDLPLLGEVPEHPTEKLFESTSAPFSDSDFSGDLFLAETPPAADSPKSLFAETPEEELEATGEGSAEALLEDSLPSIELPEGSSENLFVENSETLLDNDLSDALLMDATSPSEEDLGSLFESAPDEGTSEVSLTEDLPLLRELPRNPAESLFAENSETLSNSDFSSDLLESEPSPLEDIPADLFEATPGEAVGEDSPPIPSMNEIFSLEGIPAIVIEEPIEEIIIDAPSIAPEELFQSAIEESPNNISAPLNFDNAFAAPDGETAAAESLGEDFFLTPDATLQNAIESIELEPLPEGFEDVLTENVFEMSSLDSNALFQEEPETPISNIQLEDISDATPSHLFPADVSDFIQTEAIIPNETNWADLDQENLEQPSLEIEALLSEEPEEAATFDLDFGATSIVENSGLEDLDEALTLDSEISNVAAISEDSWVKELEESPTFTLETSGEDASTEASLLEETEEDPAFDLELLEETPFTGATSAVENIHLQLEADNSGDFNLEAVEDPLQLNADSSIDFDLEAVENPLQLEADSFTDFNLEAVEDPLQLEADGSIDFDLEAVEDPLQLEASNSGDFDLDGIFDASEAEAAQVELDSFFEENELSSEIEAIDFEITDEEKAILEQLSRTDEEDNSQKPHPTIPSIPPEEPSSAPAPDIDPEN